MPKGMDCVSFLFISEDRNFIELAMHEQHSNKCGGDQGTGPRIGSFRAAKEAGIVYQFDVVKDAWSIMQDFK
jgi:hypothetical protein